MRYCTYIGVDVGQVVDPSAVVLLDEHRWVSAHVARTLGVPSEGWVAPEQLTDHQLAQLDSAVAPSLPPLWVRAIKRYPLGTRYHHMVADVVRLLGMLPHPPRTALLVDKTGVGVGVVELFEQEGLRPIGVTITGGDQVHSAPSGYRVPKRDLVTSVQLALQSRRLHFAAGLAELATLQAELKNFRATIDPKTAHDSYSAWREHAHDDLVLALALACWFQQWWNAGGRASWTAADLQALSNSRPI